LQFDSVFESGNLAVALRISDAEYDLVLQNDVNTKGHTQCKPCHLYIPTNSSSSGFYFKVTSNLTQTIDVRFNIVNLLKSKSLYQQGMRILYLDQSPDIGKPPSDAIWQRGGSNIHYGENTYSKVRKDPLLTIFVSLS
jgi:hypothetical protein